MLTFLATVHVIACLALIGLALIQDSKSGGVFTSQTSSNSVLGATGGATLAARMTKIVAFVLLITCVGIAMSYKNAEKSVVDTGVMATTPATTETNSQPTTPTAPADAAKTAAPAPAEATPQQNK